MFSKKGNEASQENIVPLTEEEKGQARLSNMLDIFADSGLRYYLCLVFNNDYDFARRLEKGGHLYNAKKYKDELDKMLEVPQDGTDKFNELARDLEDFRATASSNIETARAVKLEQQIVKYFSTGSMTSSVKIYPDIPGNNQKPGYYFNWDTGILKYKGKDKVEREVGRLVDPDMKKELFVNLDPDKKTMLGGTRSRAAQYSASMSMSSELFIKIYENMDIYPNAKFHKHLSAPFMDTFFKLRSLNKTQAALKKLEKYRGQDLGQYALEMVPELQKRVAEFLASHVAGAHGTYENKRYLIMQAIGQYARGEIDKDALTQVVAENNRSWFGRIFHWTDDVDRALSIVKKLDSEFLRDGVELVLKAREPLESNEPHFIWKYDYESQPKDTAVYDEKVRRYWQNSRVSAKSYKDALEKLLEKLDAVEQAEGAYLSAEIPLPESLSDSLLDDDPPPQIDSLQDTFDLSNVRPDLRTGHVEVAEHYDFEDEEDEDDELKYGGDHDSSVQVEATLCNHLRNAIENQVTMVQTHLASGKKGTNFSSNCAELQHVINKILAHRYEKGKRVIYVEETQRAYNILGDQLTTTLKETKRQPTERTELIVDPGEIRAEINRLIIRCDEIQIQLEDFEKELIGLEQGTFQQEIRDFVDKDLALRKAELLAILNEARPCTAAAFDLNRAKGNQILMRRAINSVNILANSLTNKLSDLLQYQQNAYLGEGDGMNPLQGGAKPAREYKSTDPRKDARRKEDFDNFMGRVSAYLSSDFLEAGNPHFQQRERKVSLGTMFSAPDASDDESVDSSISQQEHRRR